MDNLLNKIFIPKCLFCNTKGSIFCDNCISNCTLLKNQFCLVCDKPSINGFTHEKCKTTTTSSQFISVYEYKETVRECIKSSKYHKKEFMALKKLSNEGIIFLKETGVVFEGFTVLPIPISNHRAKERGFNQTELISEIFAKRFNLKVDKNLLKRAKDTHTQHDFGRKDRFKNLEGAFVVEIMRQAKVKDQKFVLIDDISTTGATFLEAAKTLKECGAKEVRCFSLSKRVRTNPLVAFFKGTPSN